MPRDAGREPTRTEVYPNGREESKMKRAEHYHLLDSEDGAFLLEVEVCDGLAEFSDPYSHDFTLDVEGFEGEGLYRELHGHAAFELGLDHEDCYLTDEDESTILAA